MSFAYYIPFKLWLKKHYKNNKLIHFILKLLKYVDSVIPMTLALRPVFDLDNLQPLRIENPPDSLRIMAL